MSGANVCSSDTRELNSQSTGGQSGCDVCPLQTDMSLSLSFSLSLSLSLPFSLTLPINRGAKVVLMSIHCELISNPFHLLIFNLHMSPHWQIQIIMSLCFSLPSFWHLPLGDAKTKIQPNLKISQENCSLAKFDGSFNLILTFSLV